jgi:aryl-alcohol dehydrogenase-like predicted oxidoreductase
MQTRQLGSTGISLTTIGIGTWAIGGPEWAYGWGRQVDTDSIAAIRRGLELGINWIDTAPACGGVEAPFGMFRRINIRLRLSPYV